MPNLSDSITQFIITVSIGLLAVIAAIFIPIFIYRRQKNRKELTWRIISNTLVLPVLDIGERVKSKLQISYDGKSVNDLRLIVLKISNTGNIPIETNDFENSNPISFDFGEEAEILNVEILETTPASFKSRAEAAFKVNPGKVNLEPLLLNGGDAITFKVLLIKFKGRINVSARINGVKEILGSATPTSPASGGFISMLILLIAITILSFLNALNIIQASWWIAIILAIVVICFISLLIGLLYPRR